MKPLITANTVRAAAESGRKKLSVSPGSIITPAARDEAKFYGVTLDFSQPSETAGQGAANEAAASLSNIEPDIIQKIVQEVLRQMACAQEAVISDPSGLVHVKSRQRQFLPDTVEPRLKSKPVLTKKQHQIDASLMLLDTPESVPYRPQSAEAALIMEGGLSCEIEGREYEAAPGDAVVLPAGKAVRLLAKRRAVWFRLKIDA